MSDALPPLPPSPAEVSDLILQTREHVQSLGWGNRESLYPKTYVRAYAAAAVSAERERSKQVLSDEALLRWLCEHLEWDGCGYWLPEICIRERGYDQEFCPQPTLDEFRKVISELAKAAR